MHAAIAALAHSADAVGTRRRPPRCRKRNRDLEVRTSGQGLARARDGSRQALVVDRSVGSRSACCVVQPQSVCSQPSPAAQPLLQ